MFQSKPNLKQIGDKRQKQQHPSQVIKPVSWLDRLLRCEVWLDSRNIPQSLHTCTLLPPYSLCLVTVTKLCGPGQGFVSHTNQNKDPITAPFPPLLPSLSLHLLSSSNPWPWSPLMRWWVYFLCFPPFASVHPVIHWLREGLGGSPVVPYIPRPWQQSQTKGARQYNTGVLGFTDFMDWY